MSAVWVSIAVLCAGTVAIKSIGPVAVGGNPPSERLSSVIRLIAPALLAALIVYESLSADGHGPQFDARLAGVGVAAVGLLARLPLLVIVALAALATALARALG
jgi:Branched-chain amino acid transport protein (AzlD)